MLILFISISVLIAQNPIEIEKNYIEVIGKAQKEIIPNEIYITIHIKERVEHKDKISIEHQELELKKALKSIGIPLENLSMANTNSNYQNISWSKKDVLTQTEYILKVEDGISVGDVFKKLDDLKIVNAFISHVSHSKITLYKKEVNIMAIKAAKEKANYLLEAIGEELGKPIIIKQEPLIYNNQSSVRGARANQVANYVDGQKLKGGGNFTQYKKITLESSYYVKFSID